MSTRSPVTLVVLSLLLLFGQAAAQSSYWVANIQRQGAVPFGAEYGVEADYPVFRNVMSYGAVGDGLTDDTAAINNAIADGNRCGGGDYVKGAYCGSSTVTPAIVYFPPEMVGDALTLPTIKAAPTFTGLAMLDADIYIPNASGGEWYQNQNNFYRQVRNFIIDLSGGPLSGSAGIHWQVAQATSLRNIQFKMAPSNTPKNAQQGIYMENGSGGFMSDLSFEGGDICFFAGNQQFTSRNMQFNDCNTAIRMNFDWVWTFAGLTITNCDVGIDMTIGGFDTQSAGSVLVLDSTISANTAGILTLYVPNYSSPKAAGTLVMENVDFTGSPNAVANGGGVVILPGGRVIESYAQGNAWTTAGEQISPTTTLNGTTCAYSNGTQSSYSAIETTIQRQLAPITRPSNLVDSTGAYFARTKPQYETVPASGFLSAKTFGLVGDGLTDDSINMQNFLIQANNEGLIAYFDHGAYVVSQTIQVPAGSRITGELYPMIMATGAFFQSQDSPQPVWQVGTPGDPPGAVEISELIFETKGPTPGAIMIEWNMAQNANGAAGLWDVHWRIGGSAGTELQSDTCLKNENVTTSATTIENCMGAFLLLQVTSGASIYMENTWGWVADHDLDQVGRGQIDIFNGRGFLVQSSTGPVWMYGTAAEHSSLYDYQFSGASNVFMGVIQHETAYYQGNPDSITAFPPQAAWDDPTFASCTTPNCARTWGLRILDSTSIFQYGAGLYNFFDNWDSTCINTESCQEAMVDITNSSDVYLWGLNTKGATNMVSYDGFNVVPEKGNEASFLQTIALFEAAAQ